MSIIKEKDMLALLKKSKRVFLLEPPYKRDYVPLGLAKIASFVKKHGGEVRFGRRFDGGKCDLICCGSLFTYDSKHVLQSLKGLRFFFGKLLKKTPILVGGVYASLMPEDVLGLDIDNLFVFKGYSKVLDAEVPDYSVDWGINEGWLDFAYVFTSRGCLNKCAYCAVPRIEPGQWVNPDWKKHVVDSKSGLIVYDNNLAACPEEHFSEVLRFLAEKEKLCVFDNGFDCKTITSEVAEQIAAVKFTRVGMRIAFDRVEEDGMFQAAIRLLIKKGVKPPEIMVYVLFNFKDTPQEAYYRARQCANLGVRPYPQRYTPLNKRSRKQTYVGKHWTLNLVRSFRRYWLFMGDYCTLTFEEWIKSKKNHNYTLTEKDWEAWYKDENLFKQRPKYKREVI